MIELPEGITFNDTLPKEFEIKLTFESINSTKCNKCELHLEAMLATNNGRHEGIIKAMPKENILWKNTLPKDRVRSIKLLNETLVDKLDKHKERHKND